MEKYLQKVDEFVQQNNCIGSIFGKLEEKTGFPRRYFAFGLFAFTIVYLMFGCGAQFLANLIGFVYPAYASVKAIESKRKDDDTQWLTYWVVYAEFSLLEVFTDLLLWWIPFYALLKCCLLVFLMLPIENNGSVLLYYKVIRPIVLKYQGQIDSALGQAQQVASKIAKDA